MLSSSELDVVKANLEANKPVAQEMLEELELREEGNYENWLKGNLMKTTLSLLVLLLVPSVLFAEPNEAQQLKMYGLLPEVPLPNVREVPIPERAIGVVANRECGHPDAFDLEVALAETEELVESLDITEEHAIDLKSLHRAMALAATGRGAYPPGCDPRWPGIHSVSYFDDPASRPSHLKRVLTDKEWQDIIDAKVWGPSGDPKGKPFTMAELKGAWGSTELGDVVNIFAEETYRRLGVILYRVDTGSDGQHNIHVTYPVIAGSVIGVGWFPGSDPCPGDRVNLHIDKTYTSGFQGQFGLKIHELGHTLQLQHQFSGQGSHQEPMSYSYSNHLVVGYSTGDPIFGIPKSPSVSVLTKLYGGEPVGVPWKGKFTTTPTDPTDPENPTNPPTTGPVKIGDPILITIGSAKYTAIISKIDGDDGPTLGRRIIDAFAAIPDYSAKENDRLMMVMVYQATSQAVSEGLVTPADGQSSITTLRGLLLSKDAQTAWGPLFAIADSAPTAEGMMQVANGLNGNEALSPQLIAAIQLIMQFLPEGNLKRIVTIILAILGGFNEEQVEETEKQLQPIPDPVQKVSWFRHSRNSWEPLAMVV